MITLPSDVLTLLDEGRIAIRGLIRFDFGTGSYGFIKSVQPMTYGGLEYKPGGYLTVSDFSEETGLQAQQFTITLPASPDDGLTPAVLQTIEAEDYRDRPVTVYDAFFHPDTNALLTVQTMKRGYVDTIDHIDNAKSGGYMLVANCETRALDYTRINGRKRNHVDQQRRSATDKFLEHASTRGRELVYWGQDDPRFKDTLLGVYRDLR
jgi:hypothetical protein